MSGIRWSQLAGSARHSAASQLHERRPVEPQPSHSIALSDAGDGAGALPAIREAVDTYRRLAQDNPARFAPTLERSLRILEALEKS
jgi:hypothetical protein